MVRRRRQLGAELRELERAPERAKELRAVAGALDESLRERATPIVKRLAIAKPCNVAWDSMRGSEAVRHCSRCDRDVFDLAHFTSDEIDALFARSAETPCVRLRRRADGRVVTKDCPGASPLATGAAIAVTAGVVAGAIAAMIPRVGGAQLPRDDFASAEEFEYLDAPLGTVTRATNEEAIADRLGAPPHVEATYESTGSVAVLEDAFEPDAIGVRRDWLRSSDVLRWLELRDDERVIAVDHLRIGSERDLHRALRARARHDRFGLLIARAGTLRVQPYVVVD